MRVVIGCLGLELFSGICFNSSTTPLLSQQSKALPKLRFNSPSGRHNSKHSRPKMIELKASRKERKVNEKEEERMKRNTGEKIRAHFLEAQSATVLMLAAWLTELVVNLSGKLSSLPAQNWVPCGQTGTSLSRWMCLVSVQLCPLGSEPGTVSIS